MKYKITQQGVKAAEDGEFETWGTALTEWNRRHATKPLTPQQEEEKWFAIHGVPSDPAAAIRRMAEYEQNNKIDEEE